MDTAPARRLARREAAVAPAAPAARPERTQPALRDVLLAFRPLIVSIARRYVGSDEAEDVAQETLLRAISHAPDIRDPGRLKPWVCRIAANESVRRARAIASRLAVATVPEQDPEGWQRDEPRSDSDPERTALARWQAEELRRAIGALSGPQQAAVWLHYFDGLSAAETGVVLGISEGAVRKRLMDARRSLFRLLGPVFAGGGRMKLRLTCRLLRRSVICYGMGLLEGQDAERVERHLHGCDACRERVGRIMAEEEAIRRTIRAAGPAVFGAPERFTRSGRPFWSPAVALVAVAILAVALLLAAGPCGLPFCRPPAPAAGCRCTTHCGCCGPSYPEGRGRR